MLRHKSGAVSVVECSMESRIDPDPFPETLVAIEGERGSASVGPGLAAHVTSGGASRDLDFGSPLLSWTSQPWHTVQESVLRTQEAILRAWRAGKDPGDRPATTTSRPTRWSRPPTRRPARAAPSAPADQLIRQRFAETISFAAGRRPRRRSARAASAACERLRSSSCRTLHRARVAAAVTEPLAARNPAASPRNVG